MKHLVRVPSLIATACLLAVLPARRALATGGETSQDFGAFRVLSDFLPHAFPTKPMKKGRWDVKAVPGYFLYDYTKDLPLTDSSDSRDQRLSGLGAAAAADTTLFETDYGDFGFGVLGAYFKGDGRRLEMTVVSPGQPSLGYYGGDTARGAIVAATLNWDPSQWGQDKDPDGFRLPMIIGLSYMSISEFASVDTVVDAPYAPRGAGRYRVTTDVNIQSPGVLAGISPQFKAGFARLSPFVMVNYAFKQVADKGSFDFLTTGERLSSRSNPSREPVAAVGLEASYLPWGLSTLIVPPIPYVSQGASAYTLTFSKSFGG
ncbi:MAG: hypothetical protein KGK30_05125 [Elusimicrobia bacterium]|nr:hypothetical protein [Elusimicrobiota bacterium]